MAIQPSLELAREFFNKHGKSIELTRTGSVIGKVWLLPPGKDSQLLLVDFRPDLDEIRRRGIVLRLRSSLASRKMDERWIPAYEDLNPNHLRPAALFWLTMPAPSGLEGEFMMQDGSYLSHDELIKAIFDEAMRMP